MCASNDHISEAYMPESTSQESFEKEWEKVAEYEKKGRPESALEEVLKIQEKAKAKFIKAQIIKTAIYRAKLIQEIEEDGAIKAITYFEAEYIEAPQPIKSILASQLAQIYKGYLDQQSWQIRQRTKISEEGRDIERGASGIEVRVGDIREWTIEQFSDRVAALHLMAIEDKRLQKNDLNEFLDILNDADGRALRPTVYDLLVHRAIDYFSDSRSMLTEPINAFHIDKVEYWEDTKAFAKMDIDALNPTDIKKSHKYRALQLIQDAVKYQLKSKNTEGIIDLEIKRLQFLKQHSTLGDKDSRYEQALKLLADDYRKKDGVEMALVALASEYQRQGKLVDAIKQSNVIINEYPNSRAEKMAAAIITQIERKSLTSEGESVYIPNQPLLFKVNYQNIKQFYYRVYKVDESEYDLYQNTKYDERWPLVLALDKVNEGSQSLPDYKDYKSHSAEFGIEGLPLGRYFILLSNDAQFEKSSNTGGGIIEFQVTNLGMWNRNTTEGKTSIVVVDRTLGKPIEGVQAIFSSRQKRNEGWKEVTRAKSDNEGFILPKLNERESYRVVLKYGEDVYYSDQNLYEYRNQPNRNITESVTFFTDRKLYRPGQTIYFKGLATSRDQNGIPSIISRKDIEVTFKDANYQDLAKQRVTTNDFGTFHGTFTAPEGGLNGQMLIQASINGNAYVQVEEYKRPTFEVLVDTVKASYQPGDVIDISGMAKAYAGFGIDGADVEIRVTREQRFWCYPWWRRGWMPNTQGVQEVYQTSIQTDEEGKYSFTFESLADVDSDRFAYYSYVIHVDVTNQAGETRSGESMLNISQTPFALSTNLKEKNDVAVLKTLDIIAKNFADQKVDVNGTVKIIALTSPENTFIDRYWGAADTILMSRADFKNQFPNLAYDGEDELTNWVAESIVLESRFNSSEAIKVEPSKWGAGYYKIQIEGKDEKGRTQQLESYFELFDKKDQYIPHNATLWTHVDDKDYAPGDKVNYLIGTAETELQVLFEVSKWGELVVSKWVPIRDLDQIELDIDEGDRGNMITSLHYAYNNRAHHETKVIKVPWTNKNLNVALSSYRDKTKPGSEETWTVTIDNPGFAQNKAELVATMYDASLDAIMGHNWSFYGYPTERGFGRRAFSFSGWRSSRYQQLYDQWIRAGGVPDISYPSLNWFGYQMGYGIEVMLRGAVRGVMSKTMSPAPMADASMAMADGVVEEESLENDTADAEPKADISKFDGDVRDNLNETVFFYPELTTNADGKVEFTFTMNDALTRWKFLAFSHTKALAYGQTEALITTQKELMVIPHLPRFLRQDDQITITSSVKNLSDATLSGQVQLKVMDALTGEDLNEAFHNHQPVVNINLREGLSTATKWLIKVPKNHITPVRLEVVAVAGDYSDGQVEEIPVVTNRTLVTETLPLWVNGNESKDFTFESLLNASDTKVNHNYSVEFTSNPVWYAVQALPYMMEYPYDCTEQVWNRYYAHALGIDIINQYPAIKAVMAQWENTDALLSNLQKNQELKSALLKETPWVMDALSEEEQKKNVALLFDMVKMEQSQSANLQKIIQSQSSNGGFSWFAGGRSNTYISQYILEGLGRLNQLDVKNSAREKELNQLVARTIDFVDAKIAERYQKLLRLEKEGKLKLSDNQLTSLDIHYLYARSFFPARKFEAEARKAFFYFKDQARKFWVDRSINEQAMLGIGLYQFDEKKYVSDMMISLKERSLESEELGVYWKYNSGYHWSQAPIETQAKLITLYELMDEDATTIDGLKKWLLKHKQTNRWNTTKSTAAAIHALLLSGNKWIENDQSVKVQVADRVISDEVSAVDAGSGYFKKTLDIDKIDDSYARVSVENPNNQPAFGSVYYQYWEDMDAVADFHDTPLKLTKSIFRKVNTVSGPELQPVNESDKLEIGDLVTIRIVLEVDRQMEFVHMKDSRSSGLEPENVISSYKWQDGLGYYESTKDLSTDFFFDYLPKGKYVFEYPLRVSHSGQFSNGITTIQCMYAPEFTSHSNGVSLGVE